MSNALVQRRGGRFTSVLDAEDFFLRDHRILGHRTLPAAVYVEMARAAVAESFEGDAVEQVELRSIVWPRPLIVDEGQRRLHIDVQLRSDHSAAFEIYNEVEDSPETRRTVYCRGLAMPSIEPLPPIAIASLDGAAGHRVPSAHFYERCVAAGFDYGPAHRAISSITTSPDSVVARLVLPDGLISGASGFVMHPSMFDAALQTTQLFELDAAVPDAPALPLAIHTLTIARRTAAVMWAVAHRTSPSLANIEIYDAGGTAVARIGGYRTRTRPRE
ncbi:MAG TPA: polyketide synthase dehydratase domain-containing protein [Vicinamibacterales bacterium]|nr:polyketide synthase dehydratase domain-containing protein [Vicinamibacterales bacterium]